MRASAGEQRGNPARRVLEDQGAVAAREAQRGAVEGCARHPAQEVPHKGYLHASKETSQCGEALRGRGKEEKALGERQRGSNIILRLAYFSEMDCGVSDSCELSFCPSGTFLRFKDTKQGVFLCGEEKVS